MRLESSVNYFPKLHAPFIRTGAIGEKVVTGEVDPDYAWVFDDADTVAAVEKVDGENVSVILDDDMTPVAIHRRGSTRGDPSKHGYEMAEVPFWDDNESHYTEAVANAYGKGWMDYIESPGQHFGELVGPRVQGNRYDLDKHYWVPFAYARERLVYESYGEHPTDFEAMRGWFRDGLVSLFYSKMHGGMSFEKVTGRVNVEGVVFTHPDPRAVDGPYMAKLRRDMFPEYAEWE